MFNSKDPAMDAAIAVLFAMLAIMALTFAAILVVPVALGYGAWKLYDHYRPLPTFEPSKPTEDPFEFTDTHLREHVAIFAPSGWGKTQFLEQYIHMLMTRRNPPALFILDSQDEMLSRLQQLEIISERESIEDICIIDPLDKPALNFFEHLGSGSETNELFAYLFSSLEHGLSAPQATVLGYLMRLMRVVPNPTIKTLLRAVESDTPYPEIELLDETAKEFFQNQFYKKGAMQQTRTAVANRCYGILENPILEAMFSAPENKFDAAEAMDRGAWCFINTSLKHLGPTNSALFGRYFIAQILAGCYRLGPTNRLRAILILDEAFEYFDEKTERILSQARKYGLGLTFATQHLSQMDNSLRKAVFGNTAVKIAGKLSHDDAVAIAREMECSPEHIRSLSKTRSSTTFITAATGHKPFPLGVDFGALDKEPQMKESDYRSVRKWNRERLSPSRAEQPEPPTPSTTSTKSDIELVITTARRLESLFTKHYGAAGRGLHEKITSVHDKLPQGLPRQAYYVATMRNKVVHEDNFVLPDREWFLNCAYTVERHFEKNFSNSENPTASPDSPSFAIGDLVQVAVNGTDQFPNGAPITGIFQRSDGMYVLVEGSDAAVPISAIRLCTPRPQSTVTPQNTATQEYDRDI